MRLAPFLLLALFLVAPAAFAGGDRESPEVGALVERVHRMQKECEELRAAGKHDLADGLVREMGAIEERIAAIRAAHEEHGRELGAMKERLHELKSRAAHAKEEGRLDEAEALMREAEEISRALHDAKRHDEGTKGPPAKDDLVRHAEELRRHAIELRERGSVADAEEVEAKAERVRRALELRERSNEAERRAHEAKREGRGDEARELAEESGRLWREAEALLGRRPGKHEGLEKREVPDDRGEHLRAAAKHLREAGFPDRADALVEEAERFERERGDGGRRARIEEIQAQIRRLQEALEALRDR